MKPDYDTTLARIAGNIAAGLVRHENYAPYSDTGQRIIAQTAIDLADCIVRELRRRAELMRETTTVDQPF
jgi:hypothetical protein